MTYKEILRLYKSGELSTEQREQVEKELEKQEAINEYLFENEQVPEFSELDFAREKDNEKQDFDEKSFLKMIKKSIRRAFLKLGLGVGVAVAAVVRACTSVFCRAFSERDCIGAESYSRKCKGA